MRSGGAAAAAGPLPRSGGDSPPTLAAVPTDRAAASGPGDEDACLGVAACAAGRAALLGTDHHAQSAALLAMGAADMPTADR